MRKSISLRAARHAFTLVELMVAMAITLVLVYAIAEFYAYVGASVRDGRAMIEMSGQLRSVNLRLRQDLNSLTVRVNPPIDPGVNAGYFEVIESAMDFNNDGVFDSTGAWDGDPDLNAVAPAPAAPGTYPYRGIDADGDNFVDVTRDIDNNLVADISEGADAVTTLIGDGDDVLAMTIMSPNETYQARFLTTDTVNPIRVQESNLAEVVWFTGFKDIDGNGAWSRSEPRYLVRRVLPIVVTNVQLPLVSAAPNYFQQYDISVRIGFDSAANENRWYPNTLYDLTNPENRFCHQNVQGIAQSATGQRLPGPCVVRPYNLASVSFFSLQGDRYGEDIMLQNLLAFDVRVWDPLAPMIANASAAAATASLTPSDTGFAAAAINNNPIIGRGAFVDLGYGQNLIQADSNMATWLNTFNGRGLFGGFPSVAGAGAPANTSTIMNNSSFGFYGPVYDTWTTAYERDGIDQLPILGNANGVDMRSNGLDDDGLNGPDDAGERETQAPYPFPVRGVQVRIRMYEPASRQAKQVTVGMDFMEE